VHDLAAFADSFTRHNDAEAIGGVATGVIHAMAGADSSDYQSIDAQRSQVHVEVGALESRSIALGDEPFARPPRQTLV